MNVVIAVSKFPDSSYKVKNNFHRQLILHRGEAEFRKH